MKHLLLLILLIFSVVHYSFSQNNTQALLISLDGQGYVQRNNKQLDLKQPGLFIPDDLVKINIGQANLLIADGSEITLKKGQSYQIPEPTGNNDLPFGGFSETNTRMQTYILRGEDNFAFPVKSNISNSNKLQLNWKQIDSTAIVNFTIYKSGTESMVWQKKHISEAFVIVDKSLPKADYYWTLEGVSGTFTEIGEFTITNKNNCNHSESDVSAKKLLEAIDCYLQNEYYFEAMLLLNKGIDKYGENSIFAWKKSQLTYTNN